MLIIDEVVSTPRGSPTNWWALAPGVDRELRACAREAQRFVFSPAASALVGRFASECGDLIVAHRQFAIPPYETCYVEFSRPFFDAFDLPDDKRDSVDTGIAYLVRGQRIFCFSRGKSPKDKVETSIMGPLYYTWAPPGEVARFDRPEYGRPILFAGDDAQWSHLALTIGSTLHKIPDESTRQALIDEIHPHIFKEHADRGIRVMGEGRFMEATTEFLQSSTGDARNLWAALLWLNRPKHTTVTNQPAGRRFFRARPTAYRAYHIVEVDLHKMRSLRRAFTLSGERLPPRRHRVRGAFHHSGGQVGCSHQWPTLQDADGHWKCSLCGRLRWWVKDHVRGDATRGWVDHGYRVKA